MQPMFRSVPLAMLLAVGCDQDRPTEVPENGEEPTSPAANEPGAEATADEPSAEEADADASNPEEAADEQAEAEDAAAAKRLSFAEALAAASKQFPDSPAIEVEVENKDGQELYEVEFLVGDGIKEVYLDPSTGEIASVEDEKLSAKEKAALPRLRKKLKSSGVSLGDIIELAESKYDPSTIREIELEMHGKKLIMEVEVVDGDDTVEWVHDPKTGASLGKEDEEKQHGKKQGG